VWAITLDWSNPEKVNHFSMNESQLVIHFQLVGGAITTLKNMSSSMGDDIPYMKWNIKVMFGTTNQDSIIFQY
jgi:hypothetical protein